MRYRRLGNTGLIVSSVALGTMQFGGKMNMGNLGQEDTTRMVKLALDRGINFIDTADVYSLGESETLVGNALKGMRSEIVLATKVRLPMSENFNRSGATRVNIMRVAPLRLKFSLIGSRTLVASTISLLMPFKALPTSVSLSPRLYTSAVSMKLIPLSKASFTMRVVSSCPRLPMFIFPPNCIVPSATLLTMSPVFPSFLYLISHAPSAENEKVAIATANSLKERVATP